MDSVIYYNTSVTNKESTLKFMLKVLKLSGFIFVRLNVEVEWCWRFIVTIKTCLGLDLVIMRSVPVRVLCLTNKNKSCSQRPEDEEALKMKQRPDLVMVLARLSSWLVVLLLGSVTDLSVLAHVTFPSDESLKVDLPEWMPRERESRETQWKHSRPQYGYNRRGEPHPQSDLRNCPRQTWRPWTSVRSSS